MLATQLLILGLLASNVRLSGVPYYQMPDLCNYCTKNDDDEDDRGGYNDDDDDKDA